MKGSVELTGNGKTRDSLLVVKLKAETLGVVAQNLNFSKLEVNPLAIEDLRTVLELDSSRGGAGAVAVETNTSTGETDSDVDRGEVGFLGSAFSRVLAEALITQQLVRLFSFSFPRTIEDRAQDLPASGAAHSGESGDRTWCLSIEGMGITIGGGKMEGLV
jgi:hypothetical protein